MADLVLQHDIVDLTGAAPASAVATATAGGAGNNVSVVGLTIDRSQFGVAQTVAFDVLFQAVLGAGNTLSISAVKVEDSADGATWATLQPSGTPTVTPPGVVATGPAGGGTIQGVSRFGVGLRMARRYVRFDFTPVLSAANTDTATSFVHATLAGFDRLPYVPGSAV